MKRCKHDTICLSWSLLLLTWRLRRAYLPFYCAEGDNASVTGPGPRRPQAAEAGGGVWGPNPTDGSVIKTALTARPQSVRERHLEAI